MEAPNGPDDTSWWDELINAATGKQSQTPPPPAPQPPPVNQSAWEKSVEAAKISDSLGSVHDLGLIIFNETRSYTDRPDSNEPLDMARQRIAHAVINADKLYGFDRQRLASTALPVEPSTNALNDPTTRTAYESSMRAAREAYLDGTDPTQGAVHFNGRGNPGRYNWKTKEMTGPGKPLKTQSGSVQQRVYQRRYALLCRVAQHI